MYETMTDSVAGILKGKYDDFVNLEDRKPDYLIVDIMTLTGLREEMMLSPEEDLTTFNEAGIAVTMGTNEVIKFV